METVTSSQNFIFVFFFSKISEVQQSTPSEIIGDLFLDFGLISNTNRNNEKLNNYVIVNNEKVNKNDDAKINFAKEKEVISAQKQSSYEKIVPSSRRIQAKPTGLHFFSLYFILEMQQKYTQSF